MVRAVHKSSSWGQCHGFTSLLIVYMTDGGVTAKSTCLPHTSRQRGPIESRISVLAFVSVSDGGDYRCCVSAFVYG